MLLPESWAFCPKKFENFRNWGCCSPPRSPARTPMMLTDICPTFLARCEVLFLIKYFTQHFGGCYNVVTFSPGLQSKYSARTAYYWRIVFINRERVPLFVWNFQRYIKYSNHSTVALFELITNEVNTDQQISKNITAYLTYLSTSICKGSDKLFAR